MNMNLTEMKEAFKAVLNKFSAEQTTEESTEIKFADLKAGDIDLRIDGIESLEDLKEGLTVGLIDAGDVITQLEDGVYKLNDGVEIKVENSEIIEVLAQEEEEAEESEEASEELETEDEIETPEVEAEVEAELEASEEVSEEVEEEAEVDLVEQFSAIVKVEFDALTSKLDAIEAENKELKAKIEELEKSPASEGVKFQKVGFEATGKELTAAQRAAMIRNQK